MKQMNARNIVGIAGSRTVAIATFFALGAAQLTLGGCASSKGGAGPSGEEPASGGAPGVTLTTAGPEHGLGTCISAFTSADPPQWTTTLSGGLNLEIDTAAYSCLSSGGPKSAALLEVKLSDNSTLSFDISLDNLEVGATPANLAVTVQVLDGFKSWESAAGACSLSVNSNEKLPNTNGTAFMFYRVEADLSCPDQLTGTLSPLTVAPTHFVTLQTWS